MFFIIKQSLNWPKFLHVILLLLFLYLAWTANKESFQFGYLHLLVHGHQGPLLCAPDTLLFFTRYADGLQSVDHKSIAEELDGEGDRGSGYAIMVDVETLLEAIFWTWVYDPQLQKCPNFYSISLQIKVALQ